MIKDEDTIKKVTERWSGGRSKDRYVGQSILLQEFTQYQQVTSWYAHNGESNAPELSYLVMGLAGEAGETCDEVKKLIRETGQRNDALFNALMIRRERLFKEMGDTLWYLNKLCTFLGVTLEDLAVMNTLKLFHRTRSNGQFMDVEWPFSPGTVSNEAITEEMAKMGAKG